MSSKTAKPYHHGDLRHTLLETAERLLESEGVDQVSLRSIARAAGVSHAAPYHHFADMEDLLAAVASIGFLRLRDGMLERAGTSVGSALGRLQEAGIAYVRFAAENPELYRLMFSGRLQRSAHPELAKTAGGAYAALGEFLGRLGQESGRPPQTGREPAARAAWATVHGLAMLIIDGRFDIDQTDLQAVENATREVTNVLGRGLKTVEEA